MRPIRVTANLSNLAFIASVECKLYRRCLPAFRALPLNLARLRQLQCAAGEAHAALAAGPLVLAGAAVRVERVEPDGAGRWKLTVVIADNRAGRVASAPELPALHL